MTCDIDRFHEYCFWDRRYPSTGKTLSTRHKLIANIINAPLEFLFENFITYFHLIVLSVADLCSDFVSKY